MIDIAAERQAFELVLQQHFADHARQLPAAFAPLVEATGYSLHAGGKRARALLALAACRACNGNERNALTLGCALEYLHCYSLIHDDLPALDNDDTRRGLPSSHKRFGEAQAILSGDALHSLCFATLATITGRHAPAIWQQVAQAAVQMVGGQWLDICADIATTGLPQLEQIHRNKTGALITASLIAGGLCSDGVREQQLQHLADLGDNLGLAFQIIDDLLEYQGVDLGKSMDSDVRNVQPTYPLLMGAEQSEKRIAQCRTNIEKALAALPNAAMLTTLCDTLLTRTR